MENKALSKAFKDAADAMFEKLQSLIKGKDVSRNLESVSAKGSFRSKTFPAYDRAEIRIRKGTLPGISITLSSTQVSDNRKITIQSDGLLKNHKGHDVFVGSYIDVFRQELYEVALVLISEKMLKYLVKAKVRKEKEPKMTETAKTRVAKTLSVVKTDIATAGN